MTKTIIDVWSAGVNFKVHEEQDGYRGVVYIYEGGEVVSQDDYFFPKTNIPEQLLIILCETNSAYNWRNFEYEKLAWELTDLNEYEL